MTGLWEDVRFAARLLRRHRAMTIAATVTLALAIGANAAVFSVMEAAMLRPLPVRDPGRLVVAWQTAANGTRLQAVFSYPDYRDWRATAHAVESTALITWSSATVTGAAEAERLQAAAVTAGFFEVLGVAPHGRTFTAADESAGAERVAIVTERFRRKHLAAVGEPLDARIAINGAPRRIVGVVDVDPLDGVFGPASDVWLPIQQRPQLEERGNRNFTALARLRSGATTESAQGELVTLMRRLADEYPQTNAGRSGRIITLRAQMSASSRQGLILAAAGAILLLLVACANVASMMVARGLARAQEFATRAALGATRRRLVRQVTIEALALAGLGGMTGVALFAALAPLLVAMLPATTPRSASIGWDARLVFFGLAVACVSAVLSSLPAAWRVARVESGARHTSAGTGARNVLAGLQIATAAVVLIVAGLLATSMTRLQRIDAGFRADRMLTMQLQLRGGAYDTPEKAIAFVDRLLAGVEALPSVERAAILDPAPFSGHINRWDTSSDAGVAVFKSDRYLATASVFDVLGVRAIRGRLFSPGDAAAGGVVIDELLAARAFPAQEPIGRHVRLDQNAPLTVVGVVPHIKHYGLDEDPRPQLYVPYAAEPSDWLNLLVVSRTDPAASIADVRQAVRAADPDIPAYDAFTLGALVRRSFGDRALAANLAIALGLITLAVAAAGVYGSMEFLVARRVRELGVRLALGATPRRVVALVLGSATRLLAAGAAIGIPAAVIAARAIRALLFDTAPLDPRVYAGALALLAAVALGAALAPARRAARIDPLDAIRSE